MTTQQNNTVTGDDAEQAARELLVLTDLLVQAADGDFSVFEGTVPHLAEMLCDRALTLNRYFDKDNAADTSDGPALPKYNEVQAEEKTLGELLENFPAAATVSGWTIDDLSAARESLKDANFRIGRASKRENRSAAA